ncbi:FGGY-family carbohydrate kinase [Frigidibacter sp. ROC022]|uniref:FGGY-family carbohydrate kinase n=1 Tax=Frigidibacter sp. ROC022 TaxID=2971796 RepID=UPI00215AF271|nr:FGGY-family carbohydrate kinase [Frigidibacter sp. ROC022]MCR8726182.1 FGGY-family carbohydrate kinase [Frigidibacter sp. ROC022]
MSTPRHIAVIDIGKTNAKLALVDLETLTESQVTTRPNHVQPGPPYPHFDIEGIWGFLLDGLATMQARQGIEAISVTTHGASAALLAADGRLAAPVLDYEYDGPDATAAAYDLLRPDFAQTGSPRLPVGLNLGAQLHWQAQQDSDLLHRVARIVTYPQYWAARLTGVTATDVTSLGCHTDLWSPGAGAFSDLVDRLGIGAKLAPPERPGTILGPVLPDLAARIGLRGSVPVVAGIHDSNASLYPHLLSRKPPFAVVSTGTWVVAMAVGGAKQRLDPARDTLVNVDAFGQPVPSARFMGGREYDLIRQGASATDAGAALASVLSDGLMLLPAVEPGSGPFPGRKARWIGQEPPVGSARREAALSLYLAMMTAECLGMIGAEGPVVVEGPFARNALFLRMLSAETARPVIRAASATGTALGAALLFAGEGTGALPPDPAPVVESDPAMRAYARAWRERCRP